ncbi:hypothetical protein Esti_000317 [Eimeria stiedai]
MIELQFECVDNMQLSHPSAAVSLSCFVRPENENKKECKIKSVTPYLLPADLPRGDEAAQNTPQAFVDFKGAKMRLVWRGEEFLHLKINEEVHGQAQSTGFIKLHFSSLQEGIPMRVDVINRQGQPNGFLILRYALLSAADSAAAAAYPAAAADHHAAAVAELARLPTMPSNLTLKQQQQQQLRSFRIGEKPQPLQQNYGDKTRGLKPGGARQTKHSSNSGMFPRFGRWCCELPNLYGSRFSEENAISPIARSTTAVKRWPHESEPLASGFFRDLKQKRHLSSPMNIFLIQKIYSKTRRKRQTDGRPS